MCAFNFFDINLLNWENDIVINRIKNNFKTAYNSFISFIKNNVFLDIKNSNKISDEIVLINIKKMVSYAIIILFAQIFDYLFKSKYKYCFYGDNFCDLILLILMFVTFLYIILGSHILNNSIDKIKIKITYISFTFLNLSLIIPNIFYQIISEQNYYKSILLLLIISVGPFFNLKQIILLISFAILPPIAFTLYFQLPGDFILQLLVLYSSALIITQLLFTNYKNYLNKKIELEELNKKLLVKTETDQLTGLLNRYGLQRRVDILLAPDASHDKEFAIMMIDIDFFKNYNDTFGHQQGDICLKNIAETIQSSIQKSTDFVSRYGGEEFLVFIYDVTPNQIVSIAKRICENVEKLKLEAANKIVSDYVTISIGIAFSRDFENLSYMDIVKEADDQLYNVKQNTRNAVSLNGIIYGKEDN